MRHVASLICILTLLGIAGCKFFEQNPYADFTVGEIDEEGDEAPAVILVGDPQVSSRESLINDRMREVDYLEKLIEASETEKFEPQLKRDLRLMQALAFQLGTSTNPSAGQSFSQKERLHRLRQELEIAKIQAELEAVQSSRDASPNQESSASKDKPDFDDPSAITSGTSIPEFERRLDESESRVNALMEELRKVSSQRASESELSLSPEEHFEDLNAYRARLRQRQNEVRLDDIHDADGHALYRLQMTAAVMPGRIKNKFAALDIEILPVEVTQSEIRALYEHWLIDLSRRSLRIMLSGRGKLLGEDSERGRTGRWAQLQDELVGKKLVGRLFHGTRVESDEVDGSTVLRHEELLFPFFIYPQDSELFARAPRHHYRLALANSFLSEMARSTPTVGASAEAESPVIATKHRPNLTLWNRDVFGKRVCVLQAEPKDAVLTYVSIDEQIGFVEIYNIAKEIVNLKASIGLVEGLYSVLSSGRLLESAGKHGKHIQKELAKDLEVRKRVLLVAEAVLREFRRLVKSEAPSRCFEADTAKVPETFAGKISNRSGGKRYWAGNARTYQAQPTERVQRISSVASAMNSMQLGFALATLLPDQGVELGSGAAAAKTAIGMVEAIERTPVIIGYTDREAEGEARFGYVFGPKATLNPSRNLLEYEHQARNYPVFADITVPTWWPGIQLNVQSAWVENWHEGTGIFKHNVADGRASRRARSIDVRLRPRLSDAGALTQLVLGNPLISDLDAPIITSVHPRRVSGCGSNEVVFTIAGDNLWRSPAAYLRGKRHKSIKVLPDMKGLEVTFDLRNLPDPPYNTGEPEDIIVWTTLGDVKTQVEIIETRLGIPCGGRSDAQGVALRLEPSDSYLVGGEEENIRVNILGRLPVAARNLRVIYQFLLSGGYGEKQQVSTEDTKVFYGRFVEGGATIAQPVGMSDQEVNEGPSVRIGIEYQVVDGGVYQSFWAQRPVVYYKNANASKFRIEDRELTGLEEGIVLVPPVKIKSAYPDYIPKESDFVTELKDAENIKWKVKAKWNSERYPGKVVVSVTPRGEDSRRMFEKATCAGATRLTISVAGNVGVVPAIDNGTVTIAKKTDGCPKESS